MAGGEAHAPATPVLVSSGGARPRYLAVLTWSFTFFNTARTFAYLPTLAAIHRSGDSSQHSLLTWVIWLGANITMAAWLFEQGGQRCNRAVWVNTSNALMCLLAVLLIAWHRL